MIKLCCRAVCSIVVRALSFAVCLLSADLQAGTTITKHSKDCTPIASPVSTTAYLTSPGPITAVWANDGGDKVVREELRSAGGCRAIINSVWNGNSISLFGAKNEIVAFNLVVEAGNENAEGISVEITPLEEPGGATITSQPRKRNQLFEWTSTDTELFLVRYLKIRGLSAVSYETYDERHIPERLQRPLGLDGSGVGAWVDRPDHDASYPEIAVPLADAATFAIEKGQNQSIWCDIYIPRTAPAGVYSGAIKVKLNGALQYNVPVDLQVRYFALPDVPASKTMVATSYTDIAQRYAGIADPVPGSPADRSARKVMDRQMMVAHRHLIDLIDDNSGAGAWTRDEPRPDWRRRLTGELFTAANGYRGPGESVGVSVFSVGTYGLWHDLWGPISENGIWAHADAWENWFKNHAPATERFLYLSDESDDFDTTGRWADWLRSNPGEGSGLRSFATLSLLNAVSKTPSVNIVASTVAVGDTGTWDRAIARHKGQSGNLLVLYNGHRPASGSFAIEDEGVALRQLPWGQYKKNIDRWFFWQSTYYDDYQSGRGPTDVFNTAQTFGGPSTFDIVQGFKGWNASNGDGVLFYPGTDAVFPESSLDIDGPIASLRLKHWRRGIQDIAYVKLAESVDQERTNAIVQRMVPKVLWENGVDDPADPTWVKGAISWSTNPDHWEAARRELADIIEQRLR